MSGRSPRWFTGIKPNTVTVTIKIGSSTFRPALSYVTINGTKYTSKATVEVPPGTIVHAFATGPRTPGQIHVNGVMVANGYDATYGYTVEGPTEITMTTKGSSTNTYYGLIEITG